jgi:hypothetical protein
LRFTLKDHALLQYSQINALQKVDARHMSDISTLRTILSHPRLGNMEISGPGADAWGKLTQVEPLHVSLRSQLANLFRFRKKEKDQAVADLVIPQSRDEIDGITSWVINQFFPFILSVLSFLNRSNKRSRKRSSEAVSVEICEDAREGPPMIVKYNFHPFVLLVSFMVTVIACLLPIVAISVLASVHTTKEILGFIALFTAIFSMGLFIFSDRGTSSTQVFTATVA